MKNTSFALLGFALLALTVTACARRETPVQAGNRDQILHIGNLSEPQDLDPHTITGVQEHHVLFALLEGLVTEDPKDLHPTPGVAERWTVSDDGCVYTFFLRPDSRWSNGDPVTAADFLFSFQRILSPNLGAPYAYMLFVIKGAEAFNRGEAQDFATVGARAIDPHTLEITLTAPVPYFLTTLNHHSWYPVHPPTILKFGAIDQIGLPWTKAGNFVGNGPFTLQSWAPGDKIVVRKSSNYWDRANIRLNEIHFYAIGDNNIEERSFRAGQLHVTGTVPIDRIAYYQKEHPELLRLDPYLGTYYYLLNTTRPPLNDVRVRRALAMAVDRARLVRYVTLGGETPAFNFTTPDTAGYTSRARLPFEPKTAQQLLAEAGFPGGQNFPKLELLYNTSDAHGRIAQAIQQMWKETLGIEVQLVNMEWKVYMAQTDQHKYDIARAGWIGDYADPNTFLDMWVTGGGNNRAVWSNPEYDRLIAEAARTRDTTARFECFQRAEQLLMDEAPILPLYFYKSKSLVAPSVRGWYPNLLDRHPYNRVYLEP
ncbi:MAG: peptide ABC transporter substrate-binding protein [Lentisphaerae bacterium]|nr:peptide ABC transporter substrate-binding protein [Lentisphaerota bacterium]